MPRAVRLIYGRKGATTWWPAGFPASVIAPKAPTFTSGFSFYGALAPVLTVDFSGRNFTDEYAKKVAKKLAPKTPLCVNCGSTNTELIKWTDKETGQPRQAWKCQDCKQWLPNGRKA